MSDDPRMTDLESVVAVTHGERPGQPQRTNQLPGADPLAVARVRGQQMQRDILAAQGDLLDAEAVATRLGVSVDEVKLRAFQGRLIGLPLEDNTVGFPAWQLADDRLLLGLAMALRRLGVRNAWMRAAFFLSGDVRLDGRTPLEALLDGDIEAVRAAAAAYGEQLAS